MQKETRGLIAHPAQQRGKALTTRPTLVKRGVLVLAAALVCVVAVRNGRNVEAQGDSPTQLRQFIAQQVGGLDKLRVPARNEDIPLPKRADGTVDPTFQTTEAKRFLGKMLFHDPARSTRIVPEFGGIPATAMTATCGSCHLAEAASKAGTLINFATGAEGRGYTDAEGNFIARRRPQLDILPRLRTTPLFRGDDLVDELPTLTDVYENAIGNPSRGNKQPPAGRLLRTGRLDALDSVARNAPGVLGAAFNNRLLLDGFAGEPDASPGGLNPFNHPAQESVALLLLDAHRLLERQSSALQQIPAFVKLFRDAFPEEAAQADARNDLNLLINDVTVLRATATFMRTSVTRNTPFDRFLAGDNNALTPAQRRGARLFFTPATNGMGGAGCVRCHSGPMLNKQMNDPDVAGVGQFVEENFFNLGVGDHPSQALNRQARRDPNFLDPGRREINGREDALFKFRTVTMRQLKDAKFFFHSGEFSNIRDVVQYFNVGMPRNAQSGAASTLSPVFTNPRGPNTPRGLGLGGEQVDDLVDFLENALYDPAFARYDPRSTTDSFSPNTRDLTYSRYRPDLAALGAIDGRMPSGLPIDNNDALSRRDMGLEFLDVGGQVAAQRTGRSVTGNRQEDVVRITNNSANVVDTHLLVIVRGLPNRVRLENASGVTRDGNPYLRVFLPEGTLRPGQSISERLRFTRTNGLPASYSLRFLSGQGKP